MKNKLIYISALLAGCTNVTSDKRLTYKDTIINNHHTVYPCWLYYRTNTMRPLSTEEYNSYRSGSISETGRSISVSERGGFGSMGSEHVGSVGE